MLVVHYVLNVAMANVNIRREMRTAFLCLHTCYVKFVDPIRTSLTVFYYGPLCCRLFFSCFPMLCISIHVDKRTNASRSSAPIVCKCYYCFETPEW